MRRIQERRIGVAAAIATLSLALGAPASAAPTPGRYGADDAGGIRNVLPPGQNGHADATQVAAFLASGGSTRPPHDDDQLKPYTDLIFAAPKIGADRLDSFFKDATFGIKAGEVEQQYSPRGDVTIQRDRAFGVPRIYGAGRPGAMFGAGYVGAEDRLFLMDILRHVGRSELASFIGGSVGNREMDREQWRIAPYTEADLQRQFDRYDDLYGAEGRQLQADITNYVAGINKYVCEAVPANPGCLAAGISPAPTAGAKNGATPVQKLPGAYAAIVPNGDPQVEPELFTVTDVIATASLVGGIFGKGGGREVDLARILEETTARFGADGRKVFDDFRRSEDPEAPVTADGTFPYRVPPETPAPDSLGRHDAGTLDPSEVVVTGGPPGLPGGVLGGFSKLQGASNALLVSAAESESGRPAVVFGPQTGYFAPQILMELEIHAPAVDGQPGIDARGASFPGVNLYVQLGKGRDYAWSATSAGQDIVDDFALDLCNPAAPATPATKTAEGYRYRGRCETFEDLRRTNQWVPNAADQSPPGTETLLTRRTKLGLETARGEIGGKPVVYVQLRSTYMHEADSALGFLDFNTPDRMENAEEFKRAASKIGFTFNWFYVDETDIAYFNSGNNPVRPAGSDPDFPVRACPELAATDRCKYEWAGWDPATFTASYTPFEEHPQATNQPFFTSWNNKQAKGFRAADDNLSYGSIFRSEPLSDRLAAGTAGAEKMNLSEIVDAMEDAGTVDLRGDKVLPFMLRMLGEESDPAVRDALGKLDAWNKAGAHRRDADRNGTYDNAEAVKLMDAWWPRLVEAEFKPALGQKAYDAITGVMAIDDPPHGRLGSSYIAGWYGYVEKDLRSILGDDVKGAFSRRYCGDGTRTSCESILRTTLQAAIAEPRATTYADPQCDEPKNASMDDQVCFDAIEYTAIGAISQPLQPWQNRPTFQQIVEIGAPPATPVAQVTPKRATKKAKPKRRRRPRESAARRPSQQVAGKNDGGGGGELPFTGLQVGIVAALGAAMLGGGLGLRRRLRTR